ncbi:hypothetical protein [Marinobacter sp. DUT-1]|uniref:hypothetical protein n=1 Tax=Marinobacter sp. DUT-1 TaxID=3412037 RepID=UPI003D1723D9
MLHSYTGSAGTVNVTPFTDLIITLSTSSTPEIWYQQDDYASMTNNLDQAKNEFVQALTQAGYSVPADFDPFHSSFQINDTIDKLLDVFFEAVRNLPNVASYGEFVDLISSGNLAAIPSAPLPSGTDDGGSGGGDGSGGDSSGDGGGGDGGDDGSNDASDDGSSDGSGKGNGRGNGSNKGSDDDD